MNNNEKKPPEAPPPSGLEHISTIRNRVILSIETQNIKNDSNDEKEGGEE